MKRAVKVLIAVYFSLLMCIFGGTAAYAWNADTSHLHISFGKVPEGTVFADILLKGSWSKAETDFMESNGKLLDIGRDSEIAKYSNDGFTSMLFRHNCAEFQECDMTAESSRKHMIFKLDIPSDEIFNHFGIIKVAYCGKEGNILGITDEVRIKRVFWGNPAYTIKADGSNLTCDVNLGPPYFMMVLVPVTAAALILVITAAVITVKVRKKVQTARSIKRIQSGELDNERKE